MCVAYRPQCVVGKMELVMARWEDAYYSIPQKDVLGIQPSVGDYDLGCDEGCWTWLSRNFSFSFLFLFAYIRVAFWIRFHYFEVP
jgi:hypothetical protein